MIYVKHRHHTKIIMNIKTSGLYAGNLSPDANEADLTELFSGVGTVQSVEIITNQNIPESMGRAFYIEMQSCSEASRAITELHDKEYMGGLKLIVKEYVKGNCNTGDCVPIPANHMQITIHSRGVQLGPFPVDQVKQLLQSGGVAFQDMGWAPGMSEWRPLSEFAELQSVLGFVPPPMSPPPFHPPAYASCKTEPLAIWSFVLGIFSILGYVIGGFLAGIPAVICGHLGRNKIRANPTLKGAGMARAGLIAGYLSMIFVLVGIVFSITNIEQSDTQRASSRNAQNVASVAAAARAAGYTTKWTSVPDAIRDISAGINITNNAQVIGPFRVDGLPTDTASMIETCKNLKLDGDNLVYSPTQSP